MANAAQNAQTSKDLRGITYRGALSHYIDLKEKFKQQYNERANGLDQEIIENYFNQMAQEINNAPIEDQAKIITELINEVAIAIVERMRLGTGRTTKLKQQLKAKYGEAEYLGDKALMQEAAEILSDEELKRMIIEQLKETNLYASGLAIEDIMAQLKGFRLKMIQSRLRKSRNAATKYYKRSGKGYIREALVHKAFLGLIEHIDEKYLLHSGSVKAQGKDTEIDEFISFLDNIEEAYLESTSLDLSNNKLKSVSGYGVQVKPWITPWEREAEGATPSLYPYKIGSRQALRNSLPEQDSFDWSLSTRFLGQKQNTIAALGKANVFWVTGRRLYWTYSLIEKFKASGYYLSFIFNQSHQATANVAWKYYDKNWKSDNNIRE